MTRHNRFHPADVSCKGLRIAGTDFSGADDEMAQGRGSNRKILVLPGDGIGPEIMGEVMRVIEFFDRRAIARFEVSQGLVGGAAYDAAGVPLTDATLAQAMAADAVLFGSVGGPK